MEKGRWRAANFELPVVLLLIYFGSSCGVESPPQSHTPTPPPPPPPLAVVPPAGPGAPVQTVGTQTSNSAGVPKGAPQVPGAGPGTGSPPASGNPAAPPQGGAPQAGGETTTDGIYIPPIGPAHVVTNEGAAAPRGNPIHSLKDAFPPPSVDAGTPSPGRGAGPDPGDGLSVLAMNASVLPTRSQDDGFRPWRATSRFQGLLREADSKLRRQEYAELRADAGRLADQQPEDPLGYVMLAESLNGLGKYKEAEAAATEALRRDPDNVQALEMRAWAQIGLGCAADALRNAERAVALNPQNPRGYFIRALAYEALGKRGLMLQDLRRAAAIDPSYEGYLKQAESGVKLFDFAAQENEALLESLPRSRSPAVSFGLLLLAAASLAGLLFSNRKKLMRMRLPRAERFRQELASAVRQTDPPAAVPAPAARPVAAPPPEPKDGLLAGKYQMTRIIGQGGMGQVWEARDHSLDRLVAIKKMSGDAGLSTGKAREFYLKEARTLASLHHPNIVDIYEILDHPSGLYLVFELINGKTLQQILAEKKALPLAAARKILAPVCAALQFAHDQGIAHRDLKPANIMVTAEGLVKVMDFGLARRLGESSPAPAGGVPAPASGTAALASGRTRTIAGTPAYMAPEAMSGTVTPASDVYALGVCLYEMLTGERPGGDGPVWKAARPYAKPSSRVRGLSPRADELIAAALEEGIEARLPSAKEFGKRLGALPEPAPAKAT